MRYATLRSVDISNGEGIGVALFVQGCPFHCYNCFNPETWDFNGGKDFTSNTIRVILQLISRPFVKRFSILGGEPLADQNVETVRDLIKRVREVRPDIKVWVYTGFVYEDMKRWLTDSFVNHEWDGNGPVPPEIEIKHQRWETVISCDYLVDGRFVDELKSFNLQFKGSSNQRVIDIPATRQTLNEVVEYKSKF